MPIFFWIRRQGKTFTGLLHLQGHYSDCVLAGGYNQPLPQECPVSGLKIMPDRLSREADAQGSRAERQDKYCEIHPKGGGLGTSRCLRPPGMAWRNV